MSLKWYGRGRDWKARDITGATVAATQAWTPAGQDNAVRWWLTLPGHNRGGTAPTAAAAKSAAQLAHFDETTRTLP